jgi:hypothetical protein
MGEIWLDFDHWVLFRAVTHKGIFPETLVVPMLWRTPIPNF